MERQSNLSEECGSCERSGEVPLEKLAKPKTRIGADHSPSKKRLNRITGQLNAVSRMIDEREYCPHIIQQIRAATSALRSLEAEVLRGHLRGCVKSALESKNAFDVNDKIDEIVNLLKR
jgi:DNA-binding FrmR family transcriptional regulator